MWRRWSAQGEGAVEREAFFKHFNRLRDVFGFRKDGRERAVIGALIAPLAGAEDRAKSGHEQIGIGACEAFSDRENFFGMVWEDVRGGDDREAELVATGKRVPGFPNAEQIHISAAHVVGHLRRRDHAEFDVLVRIDGRGIEPVSEQIVVHRGAEHMPRHEATAARLPKEDGQVGGGADAAVVDFLSR